MRRALAIAAISAVAVALALTGSAMLRARAAGDEIFAEGVPLYEVGRGRFVRTVPAEGFLAAVNATPITAPMKARSQLRIAWIERDGGTVAEGAEVVRFDSTDLERDMADGEADLDVAQTRIDKAMRENGTMRENFDVDARVADLQLEQANRLPDPDPVIFSQHEIVDMEIDQELATKRATNARSRSDTAATQGQTELELLEIEKSKAEMRIREAQAGLDALAATAPHAGMLVLERNWRGETLGIGEDIWPGQKLAEIPDPSAMKLRAYVLEADAGGLEAERPATLTVESHPGREFSARVDRVEALAKRRHWNVPVQYFEVTILPDETDPEIMLPGQAARAEIVLEEIEDALTVPRQAVFKVGDVDTVYRRNGSHLEAVEVTVGPRTISRVQILAGLEEGDEVALRDPRLDTSGTGAMGNGANGAGASAAGAMP